MVGLFRKDDDLELVGSNIKISSEDAIDIEASKLKVQGYITLQDALSVLGSSQFSRPVGILKTRNNDFGLSVTSILTDKLNIGSTGDNLSIHKGYLNTGENLFESSELTTTARTIYPLSSYKDKVYTNTVSETITIKNIAITGDSINVNLGYDAGNPWWMYFNFQPNHWVHTPRKIKGSLSLNLILYRTSGDTRERVSLKDIGTIANTTDLEYGKGYTYNNLIFAAKCTVSNESDNYTFTGLEQGSYELEINLTFKAVGYNGGAYHELNRLGYFGIITEEDLKKNLYTYSSKYVYPTSKDGNSIVTKSGSGYSWSGNAPSIFIAYCGGNKPSSSPTIAVITYQGAKASAGTSIGIITPRGFLFGTDANNYVRLCLGQDENESLGTEAEGYSFKFRKGGQFKTGFDV